MKVEIDPKTTFAYPKPVKLADIKPGTPMGTTTVAGPDGKLVAREVHVFPADRPIPNEGHRSWDLEPNSNMTNAGVSAVDRRVVDAARSMGMSEMRVLFRVEVPNALPLIVGGLRTATLQVVATATVAAYASLGGLGRYLIDGIKVRQFHIALVGALMVGALALILDGVLAVHRAVRG